MRVQHPSAKVVVLANHFEMSEMMSVIDAGAHGYCLATIGCEALVKSLELIMLDEIVFPSALFLTNLAAFSRSHEPVEAPVRIIRTSQADRQARNLSSREAEILRCLMLGSPNKVIARELDVAEATVKVHVKAILRKIQVSNRTQAAIWATENMDVDVSPSTIRYAARRGSGQEIAPHLAAGSGRLVLNGRAYPGSSLRHRIWYRPVNASAACLEEMTERFRNDAAGPRRRVAALGVDIRSTGHASRGIDGNPVPLRSRPLYSIDRKWIHSRFESDAFAMT